MYVGIVMWRIRKLSNKILGIYTIAAMHLSTYSHAYYVFIIKENASKCHLKTTTKKNLQLQLWKRNWRNKNLCSALE